MCHIHRVPFVALAATLLLVACSAVPAAPVATAPASPQPQQAVATVAPAIPTDIELELLLPQDVGLVTGNPINDLKSALPLFTQANPGIKVTPVIHTSGYGTLPPDLIQQALKAGKAPIALVDTGALFDLRDRDLILPVDDCITKIGGQSYQADFFPPFLRELQDGGRLYGIPFFRFVTVVYYNKDAFKEVGLNPEQPPQTWDAFEAAAQKLTQRSSPLFAERWGVENAAGFSF